MYSPLLLAVCGRSDILSVICVNDKQNIRRLRGSDVYEGKTNYYCADRNCPFALWKANRFLESMKKSMDKKMAVELLKKGRTHVKGLYSQKKDSKFDADLVLGVEDGKARFSLEFPKKKK